MFQILTEICDIGVHRDLGEGGMKTELSVWHALLTPY